MWTAHGHHGPDGPDEEYLRRMSAPENEIPVALPVDVVLARTDDVALALLRLEVYSTGLQFCLAGRVRAAAVDRYDLNELLWHHHRGGPGGLLLGVEFADGRRATNLQEPDADITLQSAGGGGGRLSVDQTWWLAPLPPEGPLRVVVRSDELGMGESSVELDGADVRAAAAGVVQLWPWAPEPPFHHPDPPSVPLPPDSWFAG